MASVCYKSHFHPGFLSHTGHILDKASTNMVLSRLSSAFCIRRSAAREPEPPSIPTRVSERAIIVLLPITDGVEVVAGGADECVEEFRRSQTPSRIGRSYTPSIDDHAAPRVSAISRQLSFHKRVSRPPPEGQYRWMADRASRIRGSSEPPPPTRRRSLSLRKSSPTPLPPVHSPLREQRQLTAARESPPTRLANPMRSLSTPLVWVPPPLRVPSSAQSRRPRPSTRPLTPPLEDEALYEASSSLPIAAPKPRPLPVSPLDLETPLRSLPSRSAFRDQGTLSRHRFPFEDQRPPTRSRSALGDLRPSARNRYEFEDESPPSSPRPVFGDQWSTACPLSPSHGGSLTSSSTPPGPASPATPSPPRWPSRLARSTKEQTAGADSHERKYFSGRRRASIFVPRTGSHVGRQTPAPKGEEGKAVTLPDLIEHLRRMQDEDAQAEGSSSESKKIDAYKVAASVTDWYTEKAGYHGD